MGVCMRKRPFGVAGWLVLFGLAQLLPACWPEGGSGGGGGDGGKAGIGPPGTIIWGQGKLRKDDGKVWFLDPRHGEVGEWWLIPGYAMSVPETGNLLLVTRIYQYNGSPVFAATAFTLKPGGQFQEFWAFEDVNFTTAAFAPDGHRFVTRDSINFKWHVLDVFSNFHMILEAQTKGGTPVWAPDGDSVVVADAYLWKLTVDEDQQRCPLAEDPDGKFTRAFSFSPTGEWLAWSVTTKPPEGEVRKFLGYRFLHVPTCTAVNPALADMSHPGFLVNEEGGLPLAQAEPASAAPLWAPDGRHLLLGERLPVLSDDGKCLATSPAPLQWMAVADSAMAGQEVSTKLEWTTKLAGDQCLSWRILGFAPDGKSALLGVHRFEGGSAIHWLGREILSIPLDGSAPTSLAVASSGLEPDDGEFAAHSLSWQTGHLVLKGPPGRFARLEPVSGEIAFFDAEGVSPDGSSYLTSDWTIRDIYGTELLALPAMSQELVDHMAGESAPYSVDRWR